MAATGSPQKSLFATCHGRPFSGGCMWVGMELRGTCRASPRLMPCSSPLEKQCFAKARLRASCPHIHFCARRRGAALPGSKFWRLRYTEQSPFAQFLAGDLQMRGAVGGRQGAVCCHCGNGISSDWVNLPNLGKHGFSFLFCSSNLRCQLRL